MSGKDFILPHTVWCWKLFFLRVCLGLCYNFSLNIWQALAVHSSLRVSIRVQCFWYLGLTGEGGTEVVVTWEASQKVVSKTNYWSEKNWKILSFFHFVYFYPSDFNISLWKFVWVCFFSKALERKIYKHQLKFNFKIWLKSLNSLILLIIYLMCTKKSPLLTTRIITYISFIIIRIWQAFDHLVTFSWKVSNLTYKVSGIIFQISFCMPIYISYSDSKDP